MKIHSTKEIKPTKINALIYGNSGAGKTTLASTLTGKTVIISLESGLMSLMDFDVDYIDVIGNNANEILDSLGKALEHAKNSDYDNIFIDSLTEIAQTFLDSAKQEYPEDKHTMLRFGRYNERIVSFIKYTRNMTKNVFYTCLQKVDKDEVGRRYYVPELTGSIASKCPAFFDLVFSLQVVEHDGEKQRKLLTQPIDGYICKDRSGKLETYEDPSLGAIIGKVFSDR